MANKAKNKEQSNKKQRAVRTTAPNMPVIRTSTIDVVVEHKTKTGSIENKRNNTRRQTKITPNRTSQSKSNQGKQKQNQTTQIKQNQTKQNQGKRKQSQTTTSSKQQNKKPNQTKQKYAETIQKKEKNNKILKIIGIIGIIIAGAIFLFTTPLFNVTQIEVVGNQVVSSEEIISLSQIKLNENMFKNIKTVIKQNIKGNAYIENVETKRILPNKIQLKVEERTVKYMVKLIEKYAYINNQGYILEITGQTKEVPIIEGISTPEEEIIAGKRLNNDDLEKLENIIKIVSSCEENEISKFITSINVKNPNEYTIYFAEKGMTVHLGNSSNLDTKMLYVKAIMQAEEGNEGDIFVNGNLNDGFQPYFRKKV